MAKDYPLLPSEIPRKRFFLVTISNTINIYGSKHLNFLSIDFFPSVFQYGTNIKLKKNTKIVYTHLVSFIKRRPHPKPKWQNHAKSIISKNGKKQKGIKLEYEISSNSLLLQQLLPPRPLTPNPP